jgi:transposase-like protein
MSKKTQYSPEYKTMLLSRFHTSGISTREFASSEEIKQSTLDYWLKKQTR